MKKFLKIIISIILGAITGPLELLVMDLVLKNNHSDFWLLYVIGLMILYSFVYKILLVIFNLILYKKDEFGVHISTIFSCLSMIITYYILCRYVEDYGILQV
jgi:hypothetical protein